jgi:hypothetical protein
MTGRDEPSEVELRSALQKRVEALGDAAQIDSRYNRVKLPNQKRYNRAPVPKSFFQPISFHNNKKQDQQAQDGLVDFS